MTNIMEVQCVILIFLISLSLGFQSPAEVLKNMLDMESDLKLQLHRSETTEDELSVKEAWTSATTVLEEGSTTTLGFSGSEFTDTEPTHAVENNAVSGTTETYLEIPVNPREGPESKTDNNGQQIEGQLGESDIKQTTKEILVKNEKEGKFDGEKFVEPAVNESTDIIHYKSYKSWGSWFFTEDVQILFITAASFLTFLTLIAIGLAFCKSRQNKKVLEQKKIEKHSHSTDMRMLQFDVLETAFQGIPQNKDIWHDVGHASPSVV